MATKKAPQPTNTPSVTAAATAPALMPKKAPAAPKVAAPAKVEAPPIATAPKKAEATPKKAAPKKKAAVSVAAPEPTLSMTQLHDEIRVEAYHYFIERNYHHGDPVRDWHRAEDAVLRRHGLR